MTVALFNFLEFWVCTVYLQKSYLCFNTKSITGLRHVTMVVVLICQYLPESESRGADLDLYLQKGTCCSYSPQTGQEDVVHRKRQVLFRTSRFPVLI